MPESRMALVDAWIEQSEIQLRRLKQLREVSRRFERKARIHPSAEGRHLAALDYQRCQGELALLAAVAPLEQRL